MRRRTLFAQRERELMEERAQNERLNRENTMAIEVPNSNIISKSAQEPLKEKANMFLPHEKDIVKPNGTLYRKRGSTPGRGAANPTEKKNKY